MASALLGLGYGLCLREGLLDVETFSPPEVRGRVIGIYYVFTDLGFGLPPLLVWLNPQVGYALLFVALVGFAIRLQLRIAKCPADRGAFVRVRLSPLLKRLSSHHVILRAVHDELF